MVLQLEAAPAATRTPPHSIEAEKAMLGSVLIRPDCLGDLSDVETDDLFLPAHREILDAMRRLEGRGRAVDIVSLEDELKIAGVLSRLDGGGLYLNDIANATPTAENVGHYARIVVDKSTLRRVIATCAEAQSAAYGDHADVDEFLAEWRARVAGVELRGRDGPTPIGDMVDDVVNAMSDRSEEPAGHFVLTGLHRLDHQLGGLGPEEMIIVAANPSRGKTALAYTFAQNAALAGVPVLFFSLEMSKRQMVERAIAWHARVDGRHIRTANLNHAEWKRVFSKRPDLKKLPITLDSGKHTARRLCAIARRWRARQAAKICLIVIDYIGLVRHEMEGVNRSREVGEMSRSFKILAGETKCPVVVCAQLNRENVRRGGKDGKPTPPVLADLRDSGEIEQDADVVLFPWWDGDPETGKPHPADVIIGKQRNGPTGRAACRWEREFMTFSDDPDDLIPVQTDMDFQEPLK